MRMRPSRKLWLVIALAASITTTGNSTTHAADTSRQQQRAWGKLITIAETILDSNGALNQGSGQDRISTLVDLHAEFCRDFLGRPVSSERIQLVKHALRLFLQRIPARYSGNTNKSVVLLIRDLVANRDMFRSILLSSDPSEVIEQQLWAYMERNQNLSYREPVAIDTQFQAGAPQTPLIIVPSAVRLVSDIGTHGHFNRAIDAGETISLNIPLQNRSTEAFRSTSCFLTTTDAFVRSDAIEVVYSAQTVDRGDTVTFGPGTTVNPSANYTFTISPDCPDGHLIQCQLLVMDSDHPGKDFGIPFVIKVSNVGPLDFGTARVDDDMPGLSDGNANNTMEPGETIEYVLALRNVGAVPVENITATLWSSAENIQFMKGHDVLKYSRVDPASDKPIPASFVFSLKEEPSLEWNSPDLKAKQIPLRLLTQGTARGFGYSWLKLALCPFGVSDDAWMSIQRQVASLTPASDSRAVLSALELLRNGRAAYRVVADREIGRRIEDLTKQMGDTFTPQGGLTYEQSVGEFTVRLYAKDMKSVVKQEGTFVIWRGDRKLYWGTGKYALLMVSCGLIDKNLIGKDITGEGVPNLVVFDISTGTGRQVDAYVFELGATCRLLDVLHMVCDFVDVDGDGILEVKVVDDVYHGLDFSNAGTPHPLVILRYMGGKYVVARDLMAKPAPSQDQIHEFLQRMETVDYDWHPALMEQVLTLMYEGHEDLSLECLRWASKKESTFDDTWVPRLRKCMDQSPYWKAFKSSAKQ